MLPAVVVGAFTFLTAAASVVRITPYHALEMVFYNFYSPSLLFIIIIIIIIIY